MMQWKNNAKCAVTITVNLAAEYFWLSLSPDCIDRPKTISMGQYGMARGLARLLDVFKSFGITATFFVPAIAAQQYPEQLKTIVAAGHEIACHGYEYENFALLDDAEQEERLAKAVEILTSVAGRKIRGFRAPMGELTMATLAAASKQGIVYSSNLSDDTIPYHLETAAGSLLEIPIHWDLYDFPYFGFNYGPAFPAGQGRIANYTQVLENWLNEYQGYRENGLSYVLQLDPQTIGTPGRIGLVEELLTEIQKDKNVWFASCEELYEYCVTEQSL